MAKRLFGNTPPATTLITTGGVDASVTSLAPSTVTGWPDATTGEFPIKIDQEIMLVTNYSSPNWTVTRGQEGTTAAIHAENAQIRMPVTKASLLALVRHSLSGTLVGARRELNFKNTGNVQYTLTDDPTNEKVDVEGNVVVGDPGSASLVVPVLSGFTVDVSSSTSATITQQTGYVDLDSVVTNTTDKNIIATKALPATPYTITAKMLNNCLSQNFFTYGIFIGDSNGRLHRLVINVSDRRFTVDRYTNKTTFSLAEKELNMIQIPPWFRITDNGTNLLFYGSFDGTKWSQAHSVARGTWLTGTIDKIGFCMNTNASSTGLINAAKLLSWQQT